MGDTGAIRGDTITIKIELTTTIPILGVSRLLSPPENSPEWQRTDDDNLKANANMFSTEEEFEAEFNVNGFAKDDFAMAVHGGKLPFYKDIDIVNMKVSDGEVVARLGDTNFTWGSDIGYGAGKNSAGEDIDVMTYYPGHYIKRWQGPDPITGNATEFIQLSMWNFDGAMYVAPYYRGTFEAIADTTTFGSGEDQRILRSYVGEAPQRSTTIDNFRKYAKNNPNEKNKMSIGDWRDFDFLCL